MRTETVDAKMIAPVHEVRDAAKLNALVSAMTASGWEGRPVLVIDGENGLHQALTGSHRVAAALTANIAVPVMMIEQHDLTEDIAEELAHAYDDDDVERVLREYGLSEAADLMAEEIAANEQEA